MHGTKGGHKEGWRKLGIDPNNKNSWGLLFPLFRKIVESYDSLRVTILKDGSKLYYYTKEIATAGVEVVVKIWESADGAIQRFSDAWPLW